MPYRLDNRYAPLMVDSEIKLFMIRGVFSIGRRYKFSQEKSVEIVKAYLEEQTSLKQDLHEVVETDDGLLPIPNPVCPSHLKLLSNR